MYDLKHRMPAFKLCETFLPMKPGPYVILPVGKRCCVWFTYHRTKNICFIVDLRTGSLQPTHAAFPLHFSLGTFLLGTLTARCFYVDEVVWYQGNRGGNLEEVAAQLACPSYLPTQLTFAPAKTSVSPVCSDYLPRCLRTPHGYHAVKTKVFTVTRGSRSDMYELCDGAIALIDSCERSRMMNNLFLHVAEMKMVCQYHDAHDAWVPLQVSSTG